MLIFMKTQDAEIFALENFEGPLDFLLHLVRKSEIDIYNVPIQRITEQFLQKLGELMHPSVDAGAEFIGSAATLLWLKSKMLLPKHDFEEDLDEEDDPRFEIIHKLVEYCRFKEIAKVMQCKEEEQCSFFPRGVVPTTGDIIQPSLGIEHLTLDDLENLLNKALAKASRKKVIKEEEWRVSDKVTLIRTMMKDTSQVRLDRLFTSDHAHLEMIVTFLAILELMKLGEVMVVWDEEKTHAIMMRGSEDGQRS